MFQEMKVTTKKSSKKDSSKKSNRRKASLEETRGSELTQSFSKKFDNLGIGSSNTYENSNTSKSRTLAKIIENQEEILHQLQELNSKVRRQENQFKEMEKKMNNNFNFTNEKTFKEDTIKGVARILIEKSIYPTENQIKSEVENYDILKHNTGFLLSSSKDQTEKEKSNEESDNIEKTYKRPRVETSQEEREYQEESLEDLKEAEQEPEDNDSNNVEKEPVRKNKNILK
ncbi:hypothetical protein F8M41_025005 [Gigaspora margarita]|uniref:Uncharacterized protein n=1 Tax=Gigaspora margarita TaxID=4874 RepID=A0A8H4AA61_GIGMA|nr:hypothetical protein F8M41_025005 [Gigaspora margarita]